MTYKLKFLPSASKDWGRLDNSIKQSLLKALHKRMENPIVPKDRLNGIKGKECYKIKLRSYGIRLVYAVEHEIITLVVIGVGKRENDEVYNTMHNRLEDLD